MGVLFLPLTVALAWAFAFFGVAAPGSAAPDTFGDLTVRWLLCVPGGSMFVISSAMHTVFATRTAKTIGWQTNGFQYEVGFASLGLGVASVIASMSPTAAWLPVAVAQSIFLVLAGANHVREMVKENNFAPGNTWVLLYDLGLPLSYLIALSKRA